MLYWVYTYDGAKQWFHIPFGRAMAAASRKAYATRNAPDGAKNIRVGWGWERWADTRHIRQDGKWREWRVLCGRRIEYDIEVADMV